ncbi:hypothetical protein [Mesorhizobium kowhaii]|uniref:Glycosyltransferase RgtA/B/C/D-like domain-containing protein n=1 Tax=Mesorhizobium kowhaii TaxID=1300272 RepID=A0A2W7CB81_9HYPH|nr:hypothetical protein [Mesorhizobium kowhaii]PZV40512.1 hypothetical protein B5V02_00325 [Mesorhizobium kowhaii]
MTDRSVQRSSGSLWLQAAIVTAFFSALMIRQSLQHGRLALPPTFDDVSYLNQGGYYLSIFDTQGFTGLLNTYLAGPPHAPISTGAAFAGLALFGVHDWIGAVTNAVILLFFSRLFLTVARDLTIAQSTLLLSALWCGPYIGMTLIWFRPDMLAALLVAIGTVYIVTRTDWVANRRAQIIGGIFCGLSLWGKPTIFPLTLALYGIAVLLTSLPAAFNREYKKILYAAIVLFGLAITVSLPYYAFSLDSVVSYIYDVVFGSQADIWVHPLPLVETLNFYLTGYYGKISIGWWVYGAPVVALLAFMTLWIGADITALRRALLVVALVLIAYVAVTIPTFKGPHGFPFAATLLVSTALAVTVIARSLPRIYSTAFCALILAVSLWQFEWEFTIAHSYVTTAQANSRHALVDEMTEVIGDSVENKTILFSTSSNYSNFLTLEFQYRQKGLPLPRWSVLHLSADFGEHEREIQKADIVVAYTPEFTEVIPNLPTASAEFRQRFVDAVKQSGLFSDPALIPDPVLGGGILIFKRIGVR